MAEIQSGGGTDAALAARVSALEASVTETDTNGNPVPVNKPHTFAYDGSGNLSTDTVTDGTNTWVRTYMWSNGAQTSDSGWVKQ